MPTPDPSASVLPPDGEATMLEARKLVRHRKYGEAIDLFQTLLVEHDSDPALHDALGSACFLAGRNDEAAAHFERVTRLVTQPGKALINLGAVYNRAGEYQQAIDSIRRGLQYERRSSEGYYNLGVAHRKLNQLALAITAYEEAIRIDPKFAEAFQNLGNVLLDQGQAKKAAVQFRKALELRPGFAKAVRGLEEAEKAAVATSSNDKPFGRLVDPARRQHGDIALRTLTDAERLEDRHRLHDLARRLETAAQEWHAQMSGDVEQRLTILERRIAAGRSPSELDDANQALQLALQVAEEARRRVRRLVLELAAHEELQHSPQ